MHLFICCFLSVMTYDTVFNGTDFFAVAPCHLLDSTLHASDVPILKCGLNFLTQLHVIIIGIASWVWWMRVLAFLSSFRVQSEVFFLWFSSLALMNEMNSCECAPTQSQFLVACLLNIESAVTDHFLRLPHFSSAILHKHKATFSRASMNCKVFGLSDVWVMLLHGKRWYLEHDVE